MIIAVLLCKLIRAVGKLVGRGSSMPGQIVLKLFPNVLSRLRLPDTVIAVSGSNGKTSTVEMIAHILTDNGKKVVWNREGSNQTEGVATTLLCSSTLTGRVKGDVVLIESDERYARLTFRHFTPTHFVVTNLYRDQMTRNGHNEWIRDILADAVKPGSRLVLNADAELSGASGPESETSVPPSPFPPLWPASESVMMVTEEEASAEASVSSRPLSASSPPQAERAQTAAESRMAENGEGLEEIDGRRIRASEAMPSGKEPEGRSAAGQGRQRKGLRRPAILERGA